jgi:hypothetical protein
MIDEKLSTVNSASIMSDVAINGTSLTNIAYVIRILTKAIGQLVSLFAAN